MQQNLEKYFFQHNTNTTVENYNPPHVPASLLTNYLQLWVLHTLCYSCYTIPHTPQTCIKLSRHPNPHTLTHLNFECPCSVPATYYKIGFSNVISKKERYMNIIRHPSWIVTVIKASKYIWNTVTLPQQRLSISADTILISLSVCLFGRWITIGKMVQALVALEQKHLRWA